MVDKSNKHTQEIVFTYGMFVEAINVIAEKLKNKHYDGIYTFPRGGYILAVVLSHKFGIPLRNNHTKDTLIVDDICDTGDTLKYLPSNNDIVVLVAKTRGIEVIEDLIYVLKVEDTTWVKFWWEVL